MAKKQKEKSGKRRQNRSVKSTNKGLLNNKVFLLAGILLFTFIVLSPLLTAEFVDIDDTKLILDKQVVYADNPGKIFRLSLYTPHYKPVVYFTWMLEYYLSGNAAWMHHLNNLLLHLLNCALVFFLSMRLGSRFELTKNHLLPFSLGAALLFGIHPMHVESVAWAVERKDVLYTAFFLLSCISYLRYTDSNERKWLILSATGFLLSVFSKSPAVVLPFLLLFFDYVYKRKWSFGLLTEKAGHFGVLLLALYAFGFFSLGTTEGSIGAIAEQTVISKAAHVKELPTLYAKGLVASMKAILWYLHSWFPVKPALAYPREAIIRSFGAGIHVFPWILLAISAFLFLKRKKWPFIFFGHAFFLICMIPAIIRITPGVGIFLNDRYLYLGVLGVILVFLGLLLRIPNRKAAMGLFAVVVLLFSVQSFQIARSWQNTEKLWTNVIEKYSNVAYAYTNRGAYYRETGRVELALADLNRSVEIEADANNLNQRGVILRQMGRPQEAINDYTKAIEDDPGNHQAWLNRANALLDLRQFQRAIQDLDKAIELRPMEAKTYSSRGVAYAQMGQWANAEANFKRAVELNPGFAEVYTNRGLMHFQRGNSQQAIADFEKYLTLVPDDHQIVFDIGNIYQSTGNDARAVEYYSRAIAMNPSPAYYQKRAVSYERMGNGSAAASDRQRAGN